MRLGEKQELFARLFGTLIERAFSEPGYTLRIGEVYRPPFTAQKYERMGIGIANSNHTRKLAADVILFREGRYLAFSEEYTWLGEWWEQQHELCRWGGRFTKPDGGHFSLEHEGVQ